MIELTARFFWADGFVDVLQHLRDEHRRQQKWALVLKELLCKVSPAQSRIRYIQCIRRSKQSDFYVDISGFYSQNLPHPQLKHRLKSLINIARLSPGSIPPCQYPFLVCPVLDSMVLDDSMGL